VGIIDTGFYQLFLMKHWREL